ncbi:MAG: cell division protein FtsZ [Desulfovibrionaceae bacterium]|nr:cell division protein FtsZ [Desulfovibrionaceae bacterium]
MDMHIDMEQAAKIKVFGVGGGGGNAVQNMINSNLKGVSFICANTDMQALARSGAEHKIQLGKDLTRGLGAGAKPEVGQAAAEESLDAIREAIGDADMVFVTAGMGGGTGTGAAPVIAKAAKEKGVLTVGVVTKPFHFEGDKRMKSALKGIEELRQHVDSLVTIPNDRLLAIAPKNAKVVEMLKKADDVLYSAVRGVTDLITKPGLINADFADVHTVMSVQGMALMGEGAASGENRAMEAAKRAISSPLLEDITIGGAKAILVNITASEDMGMDEFSNAGACIRDAARGPNGEDPEIIVAMSVDETCGDEMRITVIATGIESPSSAGSSSLPGGAKVTTLTPAAKAQPEAAPAPQVEGRSFRPTPRPGAVPPEVRQGSLYRGNFDDEDRNIPAYLRAQERLQQMGRHAPGTDDFTFMDESDVPSFIRRQAN